MKSHNKTNKIVSTQPIEKPTIMKKKTSSYVIPEILKDSFNSENIQQTNCSMETRMQSTNCPTQHNPVESLQAPNFVVPPQPLLPEALNPMNLISNSSNNFNSNPHSTSSLLLPSLPPHHDSSQISQLSEHQIHHFSNFENTTYLPPTPNMLSNSFNFMIGGLDFSKNNLNGEPTYIDY